MGFVAIAVIGAGVLGAGASIYGASMNSKAMRDANASNAEVTRETNQLNYEQWLRSRGVAADGTPVNYIMPEWAAVRTTSPRRMLKKGETPTYTPQFATQNTGGMANYGASLPGGSPVAAGSSDPSRGQKVLNALDPLNLTVGKGSGSTAKRLVDPLGIF